MVPIQRRPGGRGLCRAGFLYRDSYGSGQAGRRRVLDEGEAVRNALKISAVINTRNEESRIANAISSVVGWVDEVVVVDMCSEDRTVEIARSMGAQILE